MDFIHAHGALTPTVTVAPEIQREHTAKLSKGIHHFLDTFQVAIPREPVCHDNSKSHGIRVILGFCVGDVRALNADRVAGEEGEFRSHAPILVPSATTSSSAQVIVEGTPFYAPMTLVGIRSVSLGLSKGGVMRIILLTRAMHSSAEVLPALGLLNHQVKVMGAEPASLLAVDGVDVLLVDGRIDLPAVRSFTRLLYDTGAGAPIILVTTEGNLTAVQGDWGIDDFMLNTTSPAELEARLRVSVTRRLDALGIAAEASPEQISFGDLHIDEVSYSVRLRGRPLDLTFKEFELLKYLAHHPGRVFTRAVLLQEVWGYDYFGGTRTVDVHVRRLRAKLGSEHEAMIGTIRNVGYRFVADGSNVAEESAAPITSRS